MSARPHHTRPADALRSGPATNAIPPLERVDAPVDVAVCIVEHNARPDLEACLERLHAVWPDSLSRTVTVVDNTGAEDSAGYVAATWPGVRALQNARPLGFGANVNQAAAGTNARYVLVMNPDVLLAPGAVETMVAFMDAHPEAGACGPRTYYPDGRLQPTSRRFPNWATVFWRWLKLDRLWQPEFYRRFLMTDWDHDSRQPVDWVMASCLLVRNEAFRAIDGFDAGFFLYYEDIDLCRRLWRAGYSVHYLPDAEVVHKYQRHSAASFLNPLTLVHLQSILRYRSKHGLAFGQVSNRNLWARLTVILVASDLVLTQIALQIARYLRLWFPLLGAYPYPAPSPLRPIVYWIVPIIWAVVFSLLGLYSIRHLRHIRRELGRLMAGVLLSGLVFAGSLYALYLYEIYVPRLLLAYFLAVDFLLLAAMRIGLRDLFSRNGLFYRPRGLIVGANETARRLADAIGKDIHAELDLIGTLPWSEIESGELESSEIENRTGAKPPAQPPAMSPMERIIERTRALQIDEVILTGRPNSQLPGSQLPNSQLIVQELAGALKANGVGVRIILDGPGDGASEFEIEPLYGVVALRLRAVPESSLERWVQRWFGWR